jgi:predicted transcriptional regulator
LEDPTNGPVKKGINNDSEVWLAESTMIEPKRVGPEFYDLKIEKIMERKGIPLVEKDVSVDCVLKFLTMKTHVWVIENKRSKRVVGVITEHDALSILSPRSTPYVFGLPDLRALHRGTAEDVMHRRLVKCKPEDTVRSVLKKMMEHGIRRLPVVKDNKIVGEVRLYHIIKAYIAARKKLK